MAKRGVAVRGRTLVGLILVVFLVVALAIVWRRTIGIGQSAHLAELDSKRNTLESERARLEAEIRQASSRQQLGSAVETKFGMHIPTDNQVVILPGDGQRESP